MRSAIRPFGKRKTFHTNKNKTKIILCVGSFICNSIVIETESILDLTMPMATCVRYIDDSRLGRKVFFSHYLIVE